MSVTPVSPANGAAPVASRQRVPMAVPQQRLSAPEIPGYYCYWMRGTPERLAQAHAAGYEFVDAKEVALTNFDLGGDARTGGNTDMGTRVSALASINGEEKDAEGQPLRLYLMKLKEEWRQEDLELQRQGNDRLVNQLKAGTVGAENDKEQSARYVGSQSSTNMFQPKPLRRS